MTQSNEYVADGVSRLYAYRFPAFERSDLLVSLDGVPQATGWAALGLTGGNGGAVEFASVPASGTIVRIERVKIPPQVAYLVRDENLADVADVAEARTNLGVYSTTQTDGAIAAAVVSVADAALQKAANLGDVVDVVQARTNLGLEIGADVQGHCTNLDWLCSNLSDAGKALLDDMDASAQRSTLGAAAADHAHSALEISGLESLISATAESLLTTSTALTAAHDRIAVLERNLAITTLRSQIGTAWSALKMVDGVADEFENVAGIDTNTGDGSAFRFVSYSAGSAIGNMTDIGAVAIVFDGLDTTHAFRYATSAYVGKDWGANTKRVITKFEVRSKPNNNFTGNNAYNPVTFTLYGSNTAPSSETDGTALCSPVTATNISNTQGILTVDSGITTSAAYRYHWIAISAAGAEIGISALEFWESGTGATFDAGASCFHNMGAGTPVSQAAGTVFGTMTNGNGLPAAFDGSLTTHAYAFSTAAYIGKDWGSGVSRRIVSFTIKSKTDTNFTGNNAYNPVTVTLYGSNTLPSSGTDGTALSSPLTVSNTANSHCAFTVDSGIDTNTAYRYHWLYVTASGPEIGIAQVYLFEPQTTVNVVLSSSANEAQSQPDEARLVLLHQPVDSVTLNTDVTVEASRDGGTTWTAGTLVHEGAFDATTNILSAIVDLSGQPAGTAMKWRCKTFNSKEQRLHGMWMQWS